MPRPKKEVAPEPKRRSRNGCWPCKARKVKCGEEKPGCLNCERQGETCDYSIRLNWGGRTKKKDDSGGSGQSSPHGSTFSVVDFGKASQAPSQSMYNQFIPPPTSVPIVARQESSVSTSRAAAFASSSSRTDTFQLQPREHGVHNSSSPANFQDRSGRITDITQSTPIDPRLPGAQHRPGQEYSAPTPSNNDNLAFPSSNRLVTGIALGSPSSPRAMLPPFGRLAALDSPSPFADSAASPEHRAKRIKLSPSHDSPSPNVGGAGKSEPSAERMIGSSASLEAGSPRFGPPTPYSPFATTPLTPVSSIASDDNYARRLRSTPAPYHPPANLHRLSVSSLLSDPVDTGRQETHSSDSQTRQYPMTNNEEGYTSYGYDLGQPDHDMPKNDDANAIKLFSPVMSYNGHYEDYFNGFGEGGHARDIAFEKGGYYEKPVRITISKALEPLPPKLLENPMNLLYFHHFLNHTARILMPHDCDQNPFRKILPRMALQDENILHLLLTYSASHRARLLSHPEPSARIADWTSDVFPQLRQALSAGASSISDAHLTAAIMLASLEIISPNTFSVPISWQSHLSIARQMVIARGGPQTLLRSDKAAYFLSRWFIYLDVLGSLSGSKNDTPLSSKYVVSDDPDGNEEYQIDCVLGFTGRCVSILARIAELAKQCQSTRFDESGVLRPDWQPTEDVVVAAGNLQHELEDSRLHIPSGRLCSHRPDIMSAFDFPKTESQISWDSLEVFAHNEAFHWPGQIHLLRRILGKPKEDVEVQRAVREIVGLLYKIRKGSSAEACLLFPLFTAGCEALPPHQGGKDDRERIMERLRTVEGFGMIQVSRAKTLMEEVWDTGKPWESLVSGEFFG